MRTAVRLLAPLAIALVLAVFVRATVRLYAIPSASMQPTLQVGDRIVVTPFFGDAHPKRGDVIVFRSPLDANEVMVKRVVAEPGDLVRSENGRVVLRGHDVAEPYATRTSAIFPQIVPADCYFVLGDNRENSYDSRQWGPLPRELVVGRARMVLWSSGDGSSDPHASAAALAPGARRPSLRFARMFKRIE